MKWYANIRSCYILLCCGTHLQHEFQKFKNKGGQLFRRLVKIRLYIKGC